jgi:hypothetical protein
MGVWYSTPAYVPVIRATDVSYQTTRSHILQDDELRIWNLFHSTNRRTDILIAVNTLHIGMYSLDLDASLGEELLECILLLSPPYRGGGVECSWDLESYAGGSVATGSATQAGQVEV